ncbi:MAG: formate dehydrogenase subunit alpha [Candidatus Omnitrophica bacterium]|nr:formate dehydrogenase subunit alpha [Candidatus Omnitrophota bacterium]
MSIKVFIDNTEYDAEIGQTILEVARKHLIEIPALCWQPQLLPYGACRLCIVEVKGERRPVTSCSYQIVKEIEVLTKTAEILRMRKNILSLLLSNHPADCMTCEKSGDCLLEKYAYEYGIRKPAFLGERNKVCEKDGKPFIIRDYEKCIMCGRCVRVCEEIAGANAIDFGWRGFGVQIVSGFDGSLKDNGCFFCGNCIEVCPVGALREISAEKKGRTWEFRKINTICPYCGVGCGIQVSVKDNSIVKINALPDGSVNKGWLCVKGKFGFEYVKSPDRLKKPLLKKEKKAGKFMEISWDEALDLIVNRFSEIRKKYGANALAGLASAKCTNEENYLFQKFFRQIIGTNNIDHCARLCHAPSVAALSQTLGSGAMTNSLDEIENCSDCIVLIGSNVSETQPVTSYKIRKAVSRGAKLIVIDPQEIEMAKIAEIYIQPWFGSDVMLLNALAKIILQENLINKEFIEQRVENFEEYQNWMNNFSLLEAEKITGISVEMMKRVAKIYATSKASIIIWAMGITQHITGTDNVFALSNLALLTGQIGRPGAGLAPLRGQNNVQGACDMGALPDFFPGYQKVENPEIREKFKNFWNTDYLPEKKGLTVVEIFSAIQHGQIKGLYIMGENPLVSDPDISYVKEAIKKLEFLVVQDIFLTQTAKYADLILPSACSFEKEGTFTNTERMVQKVNRCVEPPKDAKPDWEILKNLAKRFGFDWGYHSVWDITGEINKVVPIYAGITPERLSYGSLQWPCPNEKHPGTSTLHIEKFSIGRGKLKCVEYRYPYELPDEEYPFVVTTGRVLTEYHTRTMTARVDGLEQLSGEPFCLMNENDLKKLKLKHGSKIKVISRRGQIEIKVKKSRSVREKTVFIPFHYGEAAANTLTHHHLDPVAKTPEYKICAARIEKL